MFIYYNRTETKIQSCPLYNGLDRLTSLFIAAIYSTMVAALASLIEHAMSIVA